MSKDQKSKTKEDPTQREIQAEFEYQDGELIRRCSQRSDWRIDHSKGGYRVVDWQGSRYPAHRLIYILHNGAIPKAHVIDHIDGNPLNNLIENLRLATVQQNSRNAKKWKASTSSRFKGVQWHKPLSKWRAYIQENGKPRHLGYFWDEVDAALAYDKAATDLFKEFAKLNMTSNPPRKGL